MSVTQKLQLIEQEIQRTDITKREKRLLQNRKSALKCRLKKQSYSDKLKNQLDFLVRENNELKVKVSTLIIINRHYLERPIRGNRRL